MRKKRPTPPSALTDIAFLLLLFFLIMAITSFQTPVPLDPAQAQAQEIDLSTIPTLYIAKTGELYQEGKPTTIESIEADTSYALLADKATEFSAIHPIIEALKSKGVATLHLLVEEQE
ncbi:MAG: biopolymer transporter ExbD [Sphaerochaeta sp.]|jgi:biopolymer transport protein ExbD|uniref:biopolymer transporter ExbD n=1 Tax=Sphaerochaeta sp. TaxID=1972642 RepID=UPI003D1208A1